MAAVFYVALNGYIERLGHPEEDPVSVGVTRTYRTYIVLEGGEPNRVKIRPKL